SADNEDQLLGPPAFAHLSKSCRVSTRLIDHLMYDGNDSATITAAYTEAVRSCGPGMVDTCFFFLSFDHIVAEASLTSAAGRIRRGASAVVVGTLQVDMKGAAPWLMQKLRTAGASLALPPRQLMRWALNHPHLATVAACVNIPLLHNPNATRLFWRVDGSTVLGRFYLKHVLCVRPERADFNIGARCEDSFVPEMCPSGNVESITDSDEGLIIELQPLRQRPLFVRPGPLKPKVLARSLSEWMTATHRDNARSSVVFHADDLPTTLGASIAEADAFIEMVARAIKRRPLTYRSNLSLFKITARFQDGIALRLTAEELESVLPDAIHPDWFHRWIFRETNSAIRGQGSAAFPCHPAWIDYRLVLQELRPFFEDPNKRLLLLSNTPTLFTVALAERGERVQHLGCTPLLHSRLERYAPLIGRFDMCLLELSDVEMEQGTGLIDRVVPLMKQDGVILLSVHNQRPIRAAEGGTAEGFGRDLSYVGCRFIGPGAALTQARYVPATPLRWIAVEALAGLRAFRTRHPSIGLPVLAAWSGLVILLSSINLNRLCRTKETPSRGICSSLLIRLRVDRAVAKNNTLSLSLERGRLRTASKGADQQLSAVSPDEDATNEVQYSRCIELKKEFGLSSLGLMTNQVWYDDPRRLTFLLARYKFVAKMLSGRKTVGEVGCGDAFGTRIVQQEVGSVTVYDFDPIFIEDVRSRHIDQWPLKAVIHDILSGPLPHRHEGIYSLDVL